METIYLDRRPAVEAATRKGRTKLYEDIADGLFVPPVKVGRRAVAWPRHEYQAINAARLAGKTDEQIKELVRELIQARKAFGDGGAK